LVLSKFQLSPNLLSEWGSEKKKKSLSENYQEVVPAEIKSKIKEIHWTENIQDLRDLVLGNKLS
jgi:hypothetical protein